jgi:hypothetical protein
MSLQEALSLTREMRITDDESSLTFRAAIIFWMGIEFGFYSKAIARSTGYNAKEVQLVLDNWRESEILIENVIYGEFDGKNDWMEVILIAMCGAGELVRRTENKISTKKEKEMTIRKTLNDHLFEQLERLSAASDKETMELETSKAASIISVSEQIMNVARLKMDIIQAGANVGEQFGEIDTNKPEVAQIESDKKKLMG